jgi:hypothetical protein
MAKGMNKGNKEAKKPKKEKLTPKAGVTVPSTGSKPGKV